MRRNVSEVLITVNSPGEVATWLTPVIAALQPVRPKHVRVVVLITPCVYASGTEDRYIRQLEGVDEVLLPKESFLFALFGIQPKRWNPAKKGAVLHLGGDLGLSRRIGRRLQFPIFLYTDGYLRNPDSFAQIFMPYEKTAQRWVQKAGDLNNVAVTGNLMVDAALGRGDPLRREEALTRMGLTDDRPVVALFPGSRRHEVAYAGPFFVKAATIMERTIPDVQFVLALSPFINSSSLEQSLSPMDDGAKRFLIWNESSHVVMAGADLALTIPGSVSAELAAVGVPYVVALPLDRPEDIPLDGLLGYVDRIPWIGKKLKRVAVLKAAQRADFVSIPNRISGEMIVPELKSEHLTADDVAKEALRLLTDESVRYEMSRRLMRVMGSKGAADQIVSKLLQRL